MFLFYQFIRQCSVTFVEKSYVEKLDAREYPYLISFRISPETLITRGFYLFFYVQLNLVISSSLISNNRLSRKENFVIVLTWKSNNR